MASQRLRDVNNCTTYIVKSEKLSRNFTTRKEARAFRKKYGGTIRKITTLGGFIIEDKNIW
jgi:hypothetical protein